MMKSFSDDYAGIDFGDEDLKKSITERFEKIVEKKGNHIAIKTKSSQITYERLNQEANRIARVIGVIKKRATDTVAIMMEPGVHMIASIFGVLKAGKIWVPIDPSHPIARNLKIIEDSQAHLILSDNENRSKIDNFVQKNWQIVNMETIDRRISKKKLDNPIGHNAGAQIIYTSGSTGQPKGVLHNHQIVLHNIKGHTDSMGIRHDDRISLLGSLCHQAGISDMFRALLNGATLLPFNLKTEGISYLSKWLIDQKITIYHSVPTVFRQMISTFNGHEKFPHLRVIHLGGETVLKNDVNLYKRYFSSNCILVVILGSTEAPTFMQNIITKDTTISGDNVSVGKPVRDKEIMLVDDMVLPVKKFGIGEIAVRSPYIALGYHNKPELTKKVFLPDPDGGEKRIFLTGDLGQFLEDGSLNYIGRRDNQIKIGGQRVEIAEIENALFEHPLIKNCAVVSRKDGEGFDYLAAYLVFSNQKKPNVSELQNHLKEKLPIHMVPSKYIFLEDLPLLPNGKIDRRSLPSPDRLRPKLGNDYVAPQSDFENRVADIWRELLKIEKVGVYDDFFELGGQSLLAMRVLSRINTLFGIAVPLKMMFEAPTVKSMALIIEMIVGSSNSAIKSRHSKETEREHLTL